MVAAPGRVLAGALGALAIMVLGLPVGRVAAASPPAAITLPGATVASTVADIDADGVREIVRVGQDGGRTAVEVWDLDGGAWRLRASAPLLRYSSGLGRLVRVSGGIAADAAVALLPIRRGGAPAVLLFTAGSGSTFAGVCCTDAWLVGLDDGADLILDRLAGMPRLMTNVGRVDLDGDGTDELVVSLPPTPVTPISVQTLRLAGTTLEPLGAALRIDAGQLATGDIDGRPGEEMLFGPTFGGETVRLRLDAAGEAVADRARLPRIGDDTGDLPHPLAAGEGMLLVAGSSSIAAVDWPDDGPPTIRDVVPNTWSAAPLGAPRDRLPPMVVTHDAAASSGEVSVIDAAFHEIGRLPSWSHAFDDWLDFVNLPRLDVSTDFVWPLSGAVPDGLPDGTPAIFLSGRLVVAPASGPERAEGDLVVGGAVIGVAGGDEPWLVISSGFGQPAGGSVFLADVGAADSTVTVTRLRSVADGAGDPIHVAPGHGAVAAADGVVLTAGGTLPITIDAPPGTRVMVAVDGSAQEGMVGEERLVIDADLHRAGTLARESDVFVVAVTPGGNGTLTRWRVSVLLAAPTLSAASAATPFSFEAAIAGTVSAYATVAIDGDAVPVDPQGRFTAQRDAGPWPADVRIVATDALGRESVVTVTVVGFLDYRWIPWPLLAIASTTLLGVVLYLRAGRRRPRPAVAGGEEMGTWEELGENDDLAHWEGPAP
ncbi:MAG: hypothetical protein ABI622_00255 [Chloroflexota bacterium]